MQIVSIFSFIKAVDLIYACEDFLFHRVFIRKVRDEFPLPWFYHSD